VGKWLQSVGQNGTKVAVGEYLKLCAERGNSMYCLKLQKLKFLLSLW